MAAITNDPEFEIDRKRLFEEANNGNLAIIQEIATKNPELLNAMDEKGLTILFVAVVRERLDVVEWLLSDEGRAAGFNNVLATENQIQWTALHRAANQGNLQLFQAVVQGCKAESGEREQMLNGLTVDGRNVLHLAARSGHTSIASWLLSDKPGEGRVMGFNGVLATTAREGNTALQVASQQRHLETCKAIVNGCKVENGEREEMLNAGDKVGNTVLHYAASYGHWGLVSWILSNDADGGRANGLKSETITAVTTVSVSAFHFATQSGSSDTVRALLSGCTVGERLKLFLAVDNKGWTPLHWAALYHRVDIIRELLLHHEETKIIADLRDRRGMTALHRLVLNGGADLESKQEWKAGIKLGEANRPLREEVVAALLTIQDGGGQGQAASSNEGEKKEQQPQQQQAAFIDVNLGLKIEEREDN